jgi:hypothetical protein
MRPMTPLFNKPLAIFAKGKCAGETRFFAKGGNYKESIKICNASDLFTFVLKKSCMGTNGVVLCSPGAKTKTMRHWQQSQLALLPWLSMVREWTAMRPRKSFSEFSVTETGYCFPANDVSLIGRLFLGHTYISGFFSKLTICKLLTNFHRRFNQMKQVVAP